MFYLQKHYTFGFKQFVFSVSGIETELFETRQSWKQIGKVPG